MPNQDDGASRAVYRMALTPADVGQRVVVRRRLTDGRGGLGDVVGDLLSWEGSALVVRIRDGSDVRVDTADVVAGKRVPPPPPRP